MRVQLDLHRGQYVNDLSSEVNRESRSNRMNVIWLGATVVLFCVVNIEYHLLSWEN